MPAPISRHVLGSPGDQEGSGLSLSPDPAGRVASVWHSGLCSVHPGAPDCQCETATTIRSVPSPLVTDHRGQRTRLSSGVLWRFRHCSRNVITGVRGLGGPLVHVWSPRGHFGLVHFGWHRAMSSAAGSVHLHVVTAQHGVLQTEHVRCRRGLGLRSGLGLPRSLSLAKGSRFL